MNDLEWEVGFYSPVMDKWIVLYASTSKLPYFKFYLYLIIILIYSFNLACAYCITTVKSTKVGISRLFAGIRGNLKSQAKDFSPIAYLQSQKTLR